MSERRQPRGVVLAIILAGYLLVLIDVSILMAALPSIRADLGFSDTSLSWAQNAYTLTFGGLLLLGARAGDLLGRRRTFVLGIGVFTAASLAVGLAQSPAAMIAARAVQGIGAATLAPSTLALLSTSFPEGEQRSRAMAAYGALAGIGTAAGLIIGGALTETLSWRYGFLLNVPIGLAAIIAAPRYLDETVRHAGRLDVPGALSSTFGAAALVFGIVHSADAGWGDDTTIVALALGSAAHRGLRHRPGARRPTPHAAAPVRRPRPRRRLRRPLPLQRRAGQLLLLHDPVPPGRQRLHAPGGRPGLPPGDRGRLRRRDRHLAAEPPAGQRTARRRRRRRDADRHRVDEPRRRRTRPTWSASRSRWSSSASVRAWGSAR